MASKVRFAEVRKTLEQAGYTLVRISGSPHIFAKAGESLLSIPVHRGKLKVFYARQIEKIIQGKDA